MREAELQDAARRLGRTTPRAERGCPEPERLAALALGEGDDEERERWLVHVESCADCALELAAAGAAADLVDADADSRDRPSAAPPRRTGAPSRRWLALAASIALAAAVVVGVRSLREPPDTLRNSAGPDWHARPADGARLDSPPTELAWTPPEGATSARVTLFDAAFTPLARSGDLSAPRFPLPAGLALEAGKTYFWRLEAADGTAAKTFSFRLNP
jgi:hypothetical protein